MKRTLLLLISFLLTAALNLQAQTLDYPQRTFLRENAYTIHPDETFSKSSWDYLVPNITDKRIMMLGEFTHGAKEIFQLHNNLVRFLHEQLGFNTILFESGIGELAVVDINRKQLNGAQMTLGFFGGWRTKENRELMEYVKTNNISVAGFDVQRTGNSFKQLLKTTAHKYKIDTVFCAALEDRFGLIQRELSGGKAVYDSVNSKTWQLIADYQKIYGQLSGNRSGNFARDLLLSCRTIINRVRFLEYMLRFVKDRDWNSRWAARDSAMADNIRWLADSIYNNEKLLVIGHNFHIAKSNEKEKVMGEILREYYPGNTYSLGFFAASGAYADNAGKEIKMLPPDSAHADLKHIIAPFKGFTTYLHIPEKKVPGTEWLHQYIVVNDTFIDLGGSNKIILAKQFDGLLLLKKVSLPEP
ncbi:MAG TPA: erythromycin esterase family protein [Chitinophagaceae bacterium]